MTAPKWINEKEVAEMTGWAVQTLRNDRCKCKGIPYSKVGASIRYKVEDVIFFMEGHRIITRRERVPQNKNVYWSDTAGVISSILKIVSVIKSCLDIFSFLT